MTIRSAKKYGGDIYLSDPVSKDKEGNEISIMDIIGSDTDMVIDAVDTGMNIRRMYLAFEQVLKLRYGLMGGREMPQREVARRLGISRSYVSRIEKKAICKLREKMRSDL